MLVHEILLRGADDKIAVYDQGRTLTYAALKTATDNARRRLYEAGVRMHDHVAVYSRNCAEFIATYMAIASLGAVVVPINFQLSMRETAYILKNAGCRHLVSDKELPLGAAINAHDYEAVRQMPIQDIVQPTILAEAPTLPKDFGEDEPCAIIYTSGTTGASKGAVLSHRALTMNAMDTNETYKMHDGDNVMCVLPMYHCFAWTCAVMCGLYAGAALTILDAFTPKKTIDATRELGVTVIVMVPSILSLISKLASVEDLKTLRFVALGGTTLPLAIGEAFEEKFHVPIVEGYGLSEASPVVTMNSPYAPRLGTVGPVIKDVRIRIVDENGNDVPTGEPGELLVQGPNVMQGYWKMPEASAKTLEGGWLHTGDVATQDAEGFVRIVDRIKDMIISMGENIYPREIEELVYSFPGIQEAAVIAIPDSLRGQAGCCFYTVHEGTPVDPKALKKYLQQNLALFKIPREFREIKEMPKTATGKIAKRELVSLYVPPKRG